MLCVTGFLALAVGWVLTLRDLVCGLLEQCGDCAGTALLRTALLCLLSGAMPVLAGRTLLLRQREERRRLAEAQARYRLLSRLSGTFLFEYTFSGGHVLLSGELPGELTQTQIQGAETLRARCHPEDLARLEAFCREPPPVGGEAVAECRLHQGDGCYVWYRCKAVTVADARGRPERLLGCVEDISERKARETELLECSSRDSMTGLLNKRAFAGEVDALLLGGNTPERGAALLVVDLDNFKEINDSCGHSAGDVSLLLTARVLRETFPGPALVGRAGGDEFVVFLPGVHTPGALREKAGELCRGLRARAEEAGPSCALTCSVGAALYPEDGGSFSALFDAADAAMYRAKRNGKNTCALCGRSLE